MENTREDELEIDLKQIFYVLKEKNTSYSGSRTSVWLSQLCCYKIFYDTYVHIHIEYVTFN